MEAVRICAALAVAALLSTLIKGRDNGLGYLIGITGTVISVGFAVANIVPMIEYVRLLGDGMSVTVQALLKALGIAYVTELSAALCRDTNETSLAAGVELAGKAEILVISFPLLRQMVEICTNML